MKCWRFLWKLGAHGRHAFPARLLPPSALGRVNREQQAVIDYLLEENRILRAERGSRRLRLTDDQRRRLAVKGKALGRRRLGDIAGIVTPGTILRWYRRLVATKYAGSKKRVPGRPRTKPDIAALVVRMANENPTWGYTRIRGALKSLDHDVARNTIKAILKDHGIEPAPERGTKTPWKTFLAAHGDGLAAADFFTVEALTIGGLVRYFVFFVMRLKARTVKIAGITCQPNEAWVKHRAGDRELGRARGRRSIGVRGAAGACPARGRHAAAPSRSSPDRGAGSCHRERARALQRHHELGETGGTPATWSTSIRMG